MMNNSEQIMNENHVYAQKVIDFVSHLCKTYGPRITCSKEEKDAAMDLDRKLKEYCDETAIDTFSLYPDLYPGGFIRIAVFFILVGVPFMFFRSPWTILATIFPLLGFIQIYIGYMKMSELFGFAFKKGISQNATGRIYPRKKG